MAKQRRKKVNTLITLQLYLFLFRVFGFYYFVRYSVEQFYHIVDVLLKYLFNILSLQLYSACFLIFCLIF